MARQPDQLVDEIRSRRHVLRGELENLLSTHEVARRIRQHPKLWVGAAGLAGLVAGRFFTRPLLEQGRRTIMAEVETRAKTALFALAVATFGGANSHAEPEEEPQPEAAGTRIHA